jgi:hypothetical protein
MNTVLRFLFATSITGLVAYVAWVVLLLTVGELFMCTPFLALLFGLLLETWDRT